MAGRDVAGKGVIHVAEAAAARVSGMPEGDALRRIALRLAPLVGERLAATAPDPRGGPVARAVDGRVLESVEAIGKHLLLRFDGGVVVRSHLGMNGRWHIGRAGGQHRGKPWLVLSGQHARGDAMAWVDADPGRRTCRTARPRPARRGRRHRRSRAAGGCVRFQPAPRRGASRPATRGRDRKHVARRAALARAPLTVAPGRRGRGRRARSRAHLGSYGDAARCRRCASRPCCLPAGGSRLPPLCNADPLPRPRRPKPHGVLVPRMPAAEPTRSARADEESRRPARTREHGRTGAAAPPRSARLHARRVRLPPSRARRRG